MLPVPFLKDFEIEQRVDKELSCSGLWPAESRTLFDVEAFLRDHLKADLDQDAMLPKDVMGRVIFTPGRRTRVEINADLTAQAEGGEELWKIGRWRMTVAHEAGHIILHGPLYLPERSEVQTLLWEDTEPRIHTCYKKDAGITGADGKSQEFARNFGWDSGRLVNESKQTRSMEIQANIAAAALLMPREPFCAAAKVLFGNERDNFPSSSADLRKQKTVARLASQFQVSNQAALIRCQQLQLTEYIDQKPLIGNSRGRFTLPITLC